ncbi:MAG TPA: hypothetical protein VFM43_05650 [Gaiellaceae bacterium]|nr:hypothetical protein [Gaiellaceae bacterium]
MKPLRVLHCPWIVGGNPAGLAAAERELGLESTTMVFKRSPFGYPVDHVVWDDGDRVAVQELKRWRLLPRVLRDFDVIHFNFGSTLAPQRSPADAPGAPTAARIRERVYLRYEAVFEQLDLPLLRRAGKAIFVTFQGDDARQGNVSAHFPVNGTDEAAPGHYTPESDANKRRRIQRFGRYADGIYALNPDLLRVLPERARFVPYAHVDPRKWETGRPVGNNDRPLVLHAPTNRQIKGTRFVVDAVNRLKGEGIELDFQLVEGMTQIEAIALYREADLVVDQLLIGWYGGVAVEAMALGRPVVSYVREDDLGFVPQPMRAQIPIVSAEPTTIHDVLTDLLTTRREDLPELGRRSRAYVEQWHDPRHIAEQLVSDYQAAVDRLSAGTRPVRAADA